jgi:hypothetical protein
VQQRSRESAMLLILLASEYHRGLWAQTSVNAFSRS